MSKLDIAYNILLQWKTLIKNQKKNIKHVVDKLPNGKNHVITQKGGKIVILDIEFEKAQSALILELIKVVPEYRNIVHYRPLYLDGKWQALDYLELYLDHAEILVNKLIIGVTN